MNDIEQRRQLDKPATPQQRQNALNVITRNTPAELLTVDFENITKNARKMVDAVDAENRAKSGSSEDGWRNELSELQRCLEGQFTVNDAKAYVAKQEQFHNEAVKVVQDELKFAEALLVTPGLSRCKARREGTTPIEGDTCETCVFARRVQAVVYKLAQTKAKAEQAIRTCGGLVRDAKILDELRPRYAELKKREALIANARRGIREKKSMRQQPSRGPSWIQPGGMELEK
jgi:hypothetical protein